MERELLEASKGGDLQRVKELLSYVSTGEINPNVIDNNNRTPLYWAISRHNKDIVKELLLHGADPNILDDTGVNSLQYATYRGDLEIVKEIFAGPAEIDINALSADKRSALYQASMCGHLEVVQELLRRGADTNIVDTIGSTALYWASIFGYLDVIEELLWNGADPSIRDEDDESSLDAALEEGMSKVVEILEEYFPSLRMLSMRSIRHHRIDITEIPQTLTEK